MIMKDAEILEILLIELHGKIEAAAKAAVSKLGRGDPFLSDEAAAAQAAAMADAASDAELATFANPAVLRAGVLRTKAALVSYPPAQSPGGELSQAEHEALASMSLTPEARSGMEKLISDAAATALFHFFCLVDGVGDPEFVEVHNWFGAAIGRKGPRKHYPMLHDEFGELYWRYRELRDGSGRNAPST
jgi:hypothetical protein